MECKLNTETVVIAVQDCPGQHAGSWHDVFAVAAVDLCL